MVERQVDRVDHEDSDHGYLAVYNEQQDVGFWNVPDTSIRLKIETIDEDLTTNTFYSRPVGSFGSNLAHSFQMLDPVDDLDVRGEGHEAPGMLTIDRPLTTIEDVSIRTVVPGGGG